MHAEAVFFGAEQAVHGVAQRQVPPAAAVDDQVAARAQLARHDVHQADLAAVRVEQQQFLHARPRDAFAQFDPAAITVAEDKGERAGKTRVLGAVAHLLGRQEKHRQVRRQDAAGRGDDAVHQSLVHRQRQVRPVLLGCAQRQHGHGRWRHRAARSRAWSGRPRSGIWSACAHLRADAGPRSAAPPWESGIGAGRKTAGRLLVGVAARDHSGIFTRLGRLRSPYLLTVDSRVQPSGCSGPPRQWRPRRRQRTRAARHGCRCGRSRRCPG